MSVMVDRRLALPESLTPPLRAGSGTPSMEGSPTAPCLLARKACLHGRNSCLQRLTRCSQTHIHRVHSSNECVQAYERRVRAYPSRLLGYTSIETLCLGVSRANEHGLRTSLQRLWPAMASPFPAFPDSSDVCRGLTGAPTSRRRAVSRCMADESSCSSFTHHREVRNAPLSKKRT